MSIVHRPRRFAALSALAVTALTASLLSLNPVAATETDPPEPNTELVAPTDSDDDGVLDAPDTASAVAGAAAEGEPVEDLSQRTGSVTVTANETGTFTRTDYGDPIRIKRAGEWVDVDYTLVEKDGAWVPKASPVDVTIDGGSAKEAARVTFDDGKSLAVTWPEDLPEPTVEGGVATYELSDSTDLLVAVTGTGFSARIRLNEAPEDDDPIFRFGLRADGLDVTETGNGLKLVDENGDKVGGTSVLKAWGAEVDAAGDPANPVTLDADLNTVSTSGDVTTHTLDLETPDGFLDDGPWPKIVDPDISSLSIARDTWMRSGDGSNGDDYRLIVGKINGASNTNPARSYIQFNTDPIAGKDIVSAQLKLWQYYAYTCSDKQMAVHPLADSWGAGTTWANKPNAVSGTSDTVYHLANRGTTGCSDGWTTINVKNMVQSWADGAYTNNGLRLMATTEDQSSYERRFCSANPDTAQAICNTTARKPLLAITYEEAEPGLPAMTSYGVDEYMLEDLQTIAAIEGVSVQTAVDRWGWQNDFARDVAGLAEANPQSFGYAEISETGTPGAVIHLTEDAPNSVSASVASATADLPVTVAVIKDAVYTESEEAEVVSVAHAAVVAAVQTDDVTTYYDENSDTIRASVGPGAAMSESSAEAAVSDHLDSNLPPIVVPGVEVTYESSEVAEDETLRGGSKILNSAGSWCTSGWPVKVNSEDKYGLITAEHCGDDMRKYVDRWVMKDTSKKLPVKKGDIEFHQNDGEGVGKSFYYLVGEKRAITGVGKPVKGQWLGLFGRKTNGYIEAPQNSIIRTCTTVGKLSTSRGKYDGLVSVSRKVSKSGDSGGPWYSGGVAYGVHSGWHWRKSNKRSQFTPVYGRVAEMGLLIRYDE